MAEKDKIRPIYSELQGYLSQAPGIKGSGVTHDSNFWSQYNSTIDELNNISDNNYDRFRISTERDGSGKQAMQIMTYRSKLGGLISRLHGEFFSDEQPPFSGMPSTIITQTQQQSQSVYVQMLLEVNSKIEQKLPKFAEGTKERTFLQKVKGSLSSIKNATGLITLLMNMAKECGLSFDDLKNLFS